MKRSKPMPMMMADAAFLLLMFFIVMAMGSESSALPFSQSAMVAQEDAVVFRVEPNGAIFLGAEQVVPSTCTRYAMEHPQDTYTIIADGQTDYGHVLVVYEALRDGGVQDLSFVVQTEATP